MPATNEERRDYFDRFLDQRFKSIEERIEGALRHVTDLVHMVQAEVHDQNQRTESLRAEIRGETGSLRQEIGSLRTEMKESARHTINVTVAIVSLVVALVGTIGTLVAYFRP